ncbi:bifunctional molybdenum cofactor guanylyltransferase MobA/molybdopterin-guanine dinucleotide biosynthesis adaptor protein MobB [Prosthecochloris sp. GSB1]|uniref:bifunctional molybdenum cofactor guanylyltransferase MobA/molybdopterin-guanine dinucleotide biosynthesis adaptor protein MobB n=1 Tax=Prosthecochloris sp. GSB1 TaxID=281093 RepID=UPI000B8CE136|nr:bifunctional molybdenum cofactor guanylyltransferase MobA/molybdopterin-guanine dinucleotide biosynthesis adaptor protein MobB [Prosthecochloris sp. GSB1]ASQ91399.1 bifunctional molybdenum cofactor guanylyltransferase MobA/molybdopterin-guanine dinucleotide biosynthesis adaptor protein MobB [Prosthecochloris sp. GSB1]
MQTSRKFTFHPCEIAFCGLSGSGKTTLISRLVEEFRKRYLTGYYKHGCHRFDIDRQGKDSDTVRRSGAHTVMISDPENHAVIGTGNAGVFRTRASLLHLDMLLVEGLKELPLPKLLLVDEKQEILDLVDSGAVTNIIALAAPDPSALRETFGLPVFHRDAIDAISTFIEGFFRSDIENRPLNGLVLTGGKSRRMGRDKALITYHDENQLVRTAKLLLRHCSRVYISCRTDQTADYRGFGFPLVADAYLDIGPLGGLLSAQKLYPGAAWLTAACDLPFLDETLLAELVSSRNPFSFATAPKLESTGKPEPLCAIYEPKCRMPLLMRHAAENNSLRAFLEDNAVHYLSVRDPRVLDNINDPRAKLGAESRLSRK